ncbi:MAG TPA: hypothetical protein PKD90_03120 [Phnomibacter sp.]|nr:hypothetical protein [Phnomibacter sp.]
MANTPTLFNEPPQTFKLPLLEQHPLDDALDEMELLGFTIGNPFALVDDEAVQVPWLESVAPEADLLPVPKGTTPAGAHAFAQVSAPPAQQVQGAGSPYIPAAHMHLYLGQTITMLGYLITYKPVHTIKRELMYFGTFIDAAGDWLDTVHFPDSVQRYPLQGKGFYCMKGKVVEEFGVYNLEVHHLQKRGIKSRAAAKAGVLLQRNNNWQQALIRRE